MIRCLAAVRTSRLDLDAAMIPLLLGGTVKRRDRSLPRLASFAGTT